MTLDYNQVLDRNKSVFGKVFYSDDVSIEELKEEEEVVCGAKRLDLALNRFAKLDGVCDEDRSLLLDEYWCRLQELQVRINGHSCV